MIVTCERDECEVTYNRFPSYMRRGIKLYCSQRCASLVNAPRSRVERETRNCTNCGIEFECTPGHGRRKCQPDCLKQVSALTSTGYVVLTGQRHDLAYANGIVFEHRLVLYEAIGDGPHACHWGCGRLLEWGGRDGIFVDHLNELRDDNRRENLVVSCNHCNWNR